MGFHPYKHRIYSVCNGKRKTYKGYHFKYSWIPPSPPVLWVNCYYF
jgi:hypothetical protein